jgi:tetratricopeptide (TPR) repeat protein
LIETPGGSVRWSQTTQRPLGDLFELQDTIVRQIVESLPLDESRRAEVATPDMPATSHAYELYLRANEQALDRNGWVSACQLYEQCVAEDPQFAPAWARLGRMYRILGKFFEVDYRPSYQKAEAAFQRAFALRPNLPLAHQLYVYLEVETGRAAGAVIRLAHHLQQVPNQAELYAALCQAARYCGLLEASVAAHDRARRLDPQIQTSVENTFLALRDFQRLRDVTEGISPSFTGLAIAELGGDVEEAKRQIEAQHSGFPEDSSPWLFGRALCATVSNDREAVLEYCQRLRARTQHYPDGEGVYVVARMLGRAGYVDLALDAMSEALGAGYFSAGYFERDPWLDSVRETDRFRMLLAQARERSLAVDAAFQAAGGYRLLGLRPPSGTLR